MRFIGSIANRIWEPKLRPYPPETPADWEKRLRMLRIVVGAALLAVLSWQAWRLPALTGTAAASRIDPALKSLNGTLANINTATLVGKSLVEQAGKNYYDPKDPEAGFYWDIQQMIYNSTASSRQTEEFIEDLRANILGGRDNPRRRARRGHSSGDGTPEQPKGHLKPLPCGPRQTIRLR